MRVKSAIVAAPNPKSNARDRLLDATSALMGDRETLDISLSDIATKVGVTPAMVKYHFGSKNGLLMALLDRDIAVAMPNLAWLLDAPMSPAAKMRSHLAALADGYIKYPYLNKLILLMIRDADSSCSQEVKARFILPVVNAYKRLIDTGVKSGAFKPVDPMLFYFTTIGACDNMFSSRFLLNFLFSIAHIDDDLRARQKAHFIDTVMAGLNG